MSPTTSMTASSSRWGTRHVSAPPVYSRDVLLTREHLSCERRPLQRRMHQLGQGLPIAGDERRRPPFRRVKNRSDGSGLVMLPILPEFSQALRARTLQVNLYQRDYC